MKNKIKTTLALFAAFCGLQLFTATPAMADVPSGTKVVDYSQRGTGTPSETTYPGWTLNDSGIYDYTYAAFYEGGTLEMSFSLNWNGETASAVQCIFHAGKKGTGFSIYQTTTSGLIFSIKNETGSTYQIGGNLVTGDNTVVCRFEGTGDGTANASVTLNGTRYDLGAWTLTSMSWDSSAGERNKYSMGCMAPGWGNNDKLTKSTIANNTITATYTVEQPSEKYHNQLAGETFVPATTYGSITVPGEGYKATALTGKTEIGTSGTGIGGNFDGMFGGSCYINSHTVSGWFKVDTLPSSGSYKLLWSMRNEKTNLAGYAVVVGSDGKVYFDRTTNDNSPTPSLQTTNYKTANAVITEGVWCYLAISIEKTGSQAGTVKFYKNGGEAETLTTALDVRLNGGTTIQKFYLGGSGVSAAGFYIDNRVLTQPATIQALATNEDYVVPIVTGAARIGSKGYETVAAAFEAVQDGQTVVLLQACTETLTAPAKTFTLDLGGFAMSGSLATVDNSNITLTYGTGGSFTSSVTGGGTIVLPNNTLPTDAFKTSLTQTAWTGTLWIKNKTAWNAWDFESYGNANSKIKLTGVTGYAPNSAKTCNAEIILEDDGNTKALTISDGYSSSTYAYTIAKLSGSGTWTRSTGAAQNYNISDISGFTGAFALSDGGPVINIGTGTHATVKDNGGIIYVDSGYAATIASGKTWAVKNGIFVNGTLTNNGTITGTVKGSGTLVYSGVSSAPTAPTGLTASDWMGTVWFKNANVGGWDFSNYCNDASKVKFTGVKGWLKNTGTDNVCPQGIAELVLENDGDTLAFEMTDSSQDRAYTFTKFTGGGTFKCATSSDKACAVAVADVSDFTGKLISAAGTSANPRPIYIADTVTSTIAGTDSLINVAAGEAIVANAGWEATSVAFGATLTVKGNVNDVIVSGVTTAPTLNTTVTLQDPTTGSQVAGSYKLEYDSVSQQVKVVDAIVYLGWDATQSAWTNGVGTVVTTITTDHALVAKNGDNITFGAATTPGSFNMPETGTVTITDQNNLTVSAIDIPTGATLAIGADATPGFNVTGTGVFKYAASSANGTPVPASKLADFNGTFWMAKGRHRYSGVAIAQTVTLKITDGATLMPEGDNAVTTWNNPMIVSGQGWGDSGVESCAIRLHQKAQLGTGCTITFEKVNDKNPTIGTTQADNSSVINATLTGSDGFEVRGTGTLVLGQPKTQAAGLSGNIIVAGGTLRIGNGNNSGCSAGNEVQLGNTTITVNNGAAVAAWCWTTVKETALTTDKVNIMTPITLNNGAQLNGPDGAHAFMGAVTVNGTASGTFGYHKGWAFNNLIIPAGSTFNATCSADSSFNAYFSVLGGDVKGALNVTNGGGNNKEMRVCVANDALADGALNIQNNGGIGAYVFVLGNVTLGTLTGNAAAIFGDNNATYTLTLKGGTVGSVIKDCEQGVSAEHPLSVIVAGDVTFSGANTYSGTTTVNSGSLKLAGDTIGTGNYTIAGGTLDVRTHRSVPVASIAEDAKLSVKQASSSEEVHTIAITGTSLTDGDYASKVQVVSAEDEATLLTIKTATVASGTLTIQLEGGTAEAEITGSTTWSALWSGKTPPGANTTVNLTVSSSATLTIDAEVHIAELSVTSVDGKKLTIAFAADSSLHATVYDFSNAAGKVAFDCTGMTAPKTLISGTIEGVANIDTAGSTTPTGTHLYVDATGVYLAADVYQKFVNNPAVFTYAGAETFHTGTYNLFDINKGIDTGTTYTGNAASTTFPGWEGTSIVPWEAFSTGKDHARYKAPGYVLRFASGTGTAGNVNANFVIFSLGGMIVESGASGWTFTSDSSGQRSTQLGDQDGTDDTWFIFNESFTFSRGTSTTAENVSLTLYGAVNFDIATDKTVTLNKAQTACSPTLDTGTHAKLKMHGAGQILVNTLTATGDVTLDYTDVSLDRQTPYIDGTLTIDSDTIIKLPAGLTAGTAFPMATTLSGATSGARTIYIGGVESQKMVAFDAEHGTITYADITIYKAEVSGDTDWSAIVWTPTPQGAFPETAELIITNTGNSATITMNADVTVAELLLVSASNKVTTFASGGGAVSIGTYEFSEAAGKVTVGFSTGAASVTAGSDTVLAEAGTDGGSITVGDGMKATVPAWYFDHRAVHPGGYLKFTGDVGERSLDGTGCIPSNGATIELANTATISGTFASGVDNTKIVVSGDNIKTTGAVNLVNDSKSIFEVAGGTFTLQDRVMPGQNNKTTTVLISGGSMVGQPGTGFWYPGGGWGSGKSTLTLSGSGSFTVPYEPYNGTGANCITGHDATVNVGDTAVFAPTLIGYITSSSYSANPNWTTDVANSKHRVNMTGGTFNVPAGVPNWLPINVNGNATIGVQTGVTAPVVRSTITVAADQTATFSIPDGTTLEAKSLAGSGAFAISGAGTLDIGTNRVSTINGGNVAVTLTDEEAKIGGVAKVMFTGTATVTKVMYGGQDITSKCDISGGSVTIKTSECEATVGSTYYVALATAIGEATEGSTITLLKDAALAAATTLNNSASLVTGEFAISGDGGINVASGKTISITNGVIGVDLGGEGSFNLTGGFYKTNTVTLAGNYRFVALSAVYKGCNFEVVAGSTPHPQGDEKVYKAGDEGTVVVSESDLVSKGYIESGDNVQEFLNGTGENGFPNWKNVVLKLSATEATSKPVPAPQQTAASGYINFKLGGVTVDTSSGATVTYKVYKADSPDASSWTAASDEVGYSAEATVQLEGSGVKYYKFDVIVTPAK